LNRSKELSYRLRHNEMRGFWIRNRYLCYINYELQLFITHILKVDNYVWRSSFIMRIVN